ncbi:MAG TPA: hypothetical protein VLB84_02490, partial [Bacteroidia bacterium]|nr:hypothetical protein [Bacteroidia bacterium]
AIKRGIEQILAPRGLDIGFDLKKVTGQMNKEIEQKQKYMEEKTGDKAVQEKGEIIIQDRIKKGYKPKTVAERVKEFTNLNPKLLTELMVYDNSEEAKDRKIKQLQRGVELEESNDAVEELEALVRDMEEMDLILSELEELQKAA